MRINCTHGQQFSKNRFMLEIRIVSELNICQKSLPIPISSPENIQITQNIHYFEYLEVIWGSRSIESEKNGMKNQNRLNIFHNFYPQSGKSVQIITFNIFF